MSFEDLPVPASVSTVMGLQAYTTTLSLHVWVLAINPGLLAVMASTLQTEHFPRPLL